MYIYRIRCDVQPDGWLSRARIHTARRDSTDACSLNTSVKHARHTVHIRVVAEWPRCDESVNRPRTQRHTRVDRPTVTRHGRVITGRDGCGFHADTVARSAVLRTRWINYSRCPGRARTAVAATLTKHKHHPPTDGDTGCSRWAWTGEHTGYSCVCCSSNLYVLHSTVEDLDRTLQ